MRDEKRTSWSGIRGLYSLLPLVSLLSPLLAIPAVAADSEKEKKKEKWYQIEVIIFQQQDHYRQEQPRRDIQLSYPTNYLEFVDPSSPATEKITDSKPEKEQPFIMLDKSQRQMNTEATTLRRRSGYQVLFHQAWRQPGIGYNHAPWLLVRVGDNYDGHFELEGSLRLVLSNYLHLETDMWLSSFAENFGQENEVWPPLPAYPIAEVVEEITEQQLEESELDNSFESDNPESPSVSDNELSWPFPGTEPELENAYLVTSIDRFNTNRKLKLNELHYLDHPRMGVLVRVTRYKLPKPVPEPQPLTPTLQPAAEQVQ